jgi:hypothetical protein
MLILNIMDFLGSPVYKSLLRTTKDAWFSICQIQKKAAKERRFAFRARGTKGAACGAVTM